MIMVLQRERRARKRIAVALCAAMALSAFPAMGEEKKDESVELPDVVVTATRTEKVVMDAPASVSVVTARDIAKKNVQRVDEVLKDMEGVYVRGLGGHTPSAWADTVTMRGLSGYYRTAVMVDGQSMNNAFSAGVNWASLAIEDIQSIEVVHGPFSSLYGGSAMGGVINVISKVPQKREFVLKSGYGTNDLKSLDFRYADRLFDRLALSVNYGYKESNGYVMDYVTKSASSGAGAIPVSGWRRTTDSSGNTVYLLGDKGEKEWWQQNAGLKLFYDITPSSKVSLGVSYHEHETDFDKFHTYLRNGSGNPVSSGSITFDDSGNKKITLTEKDFLFGPNGEESLRYTAGYENRLAGGVKVKADLFFMDNGYWYITQESGATQGGGPGKLVDIPNTKLGGSVQVSFSVSDKHLLVAGVSANRDELEKKEYGLASWRTDSAKGSVRYRADGESNFYAVYLQDEITLRDNLTLYIGGRYDYWETEGTVQQFTAPAFRNDYSTRTKSAFSPKASLVYKPLKDTTLRASAGSAFRAPNLSDMYSTWITSGGKTNESNPDLDPEKTNSWEVGFEQRFSSTGTTIRATYYENYLKDLIYSSDVSSTLNVKRNAGEAEVKGIELGIRQAVVKGVAAFANFTYNNAKITENSAIPATEGKRMTLTPERMFNVGLEGKKGPWSGSVIGRYVGDVYSNDQNRDTVNNVPGSYDPYFVVDAKAAYQFTENVAFSLAVDNLLDRDYYQSDKAQDMAWYAELTVRF